MSKNVTVTLSYETWIAVMSVLKIVEEKKSIRRTKENDEDIKFAHFTIQTALVNSNLSSTIQESEVVSDNR